MAIDSLSQLAKRLKPFIVKWINDEVGGSSGAGIASEVSDHGQLLGLSDDDHVQYLLDQASTAGDGLIIGSRILAVGDGDGLTVNADNVVLGTPSTLTPTTTNAVTASSHTHNLDTAAPSDDLTVSTSNAEGGDATLSRGDHIHAITTSDNPGANAIILASDASGDLQLEHIGVGVSPTRYLDVLGTSEQLRLAWDAGNYTSFTVSSGGNLSIEPNGNLLLETGSGSDHIDPITNYKENLGQLSKKYLTLHAAELWVETLVAQETIATIGGRILVGPTTKFEVDLPDSTTVTDEILNGGFEDAGVGDPDFFADWTENVGDGTIAIGTARTGSNGCRLVSGASSDTYVHQNVTVAPDDVYSLRFFTKSFTADTDIGRYNVYDVTNAAPIIALTTVNCVAGDNSNYYETSVNFTVPALCVSIRIYFRCPDTDTDRAIFDDITLTQGVEISTEHNQMTPGDNAYSEADGKVEFFWIIDGPAGAESPYTYMVNRNLDGTGENDWFAGDALFNTGAIDNGFIDLYSYSGIKSGTTGPTIVGNIRNGIEFNDWSENWAIGNLNGIYGYSGNTYGSAFGKYETGIPWVSMDSTNGFRVMQHTTQLAKWDTSGNILIGQTSAGESNIYIASGAIQLRTGTDVNIQLQSDGDAIFGATTGGHIFWDNSDSELQIKDGSTQLVVVDSSGNVTLGEVATNQGNVFWNTSNKRLEFRGGANDGTDVEAYVDTDGAFAIAGGNVKMDGDGINLTRESTDRITYYNALGGTTVGGLSVTYYGGRSVFEILSRGYTSDTYPAYPDVTLVSQTHDMSFSGFLRVRADTVSIYGDAENSDVDLAVLGDIRAERGIYVGSWTGAPDENDIHYEGNLKSVKSSITKDVYAYNVFGAPATSSNNNLNGTTGNTTKSKTLVDISDFSMSADKASAKAFAIYYAIKDSDSSGTDCAVWFGRDTGSYEDFGVTCLSIDDRWTRGYGIVATNGTNGDFYYQVVASGTETLDIVIKIIGMFL